MVEGGEEEEVLVLEVEDVLVSVRFALLAASSRDAWTARSSSSPHTSSGPGWGCLSVSGT